MPKDLMGWVPLFSAAIALFGLIWIYFGAFLNIKERLVALETKMELFWKPLQAFLTNAIHHPNTPTIDDKLERFDNLTMEELYELRADIKATMDATEDKKGVTVLYYTLLLSRIDSRVFDKRVELCKPKGGLVTRVRLLWK